MRPIDYATPRWERLYPQGRPLSEDPWQRVLAATATKGITPHEYQRIDVDFAIANLAQGRGAFIGWDVGLGKTLGAAMVMDGGGNNFNLVVCLNSAKAQWARMLAAYCPWMTVLVMGNTRAQREGVLAHAAALVRQGDPFTLVCHYEAVAVVDGPQKKGWKPLGSWDLVILDEAHRLVGRTTKVASAMRRLQRAGTLMLSGSVMTGKGDKLFVPLQILRPAKYRSKWRDWITPYFEVTNNGWSTEVGDPWPHKLDALRAELGEVLVVRTSQHCPIPHEVEHWVDLYPEQRKAYDELVEQLMAELPSGETVTVTDGTALISALRQVTGGTGFDRSAKHDRALEIVQGAGGQMVAFAWHKAVAARLATMIDAAGITAGLINGDVPIPKRNGLIEAFRHGEPRMLAATLKTLGESANLQNADGVVFIEESYVAEDNRQARGRVVRQGQQGTATVHYVRASGTVDGRVLESATTKAQLRRLVLGV